jgi:uncharacterized membrane protein
MKFSRLAVLMAVTLINAACSRAPSVDIMGSFFPIWMICLVIAIFMVAALRLLLQRTRLETEVGPLPLFYPCAVILFTGLLWVIFFR